MGKRSKRRHRFDTRNRSVSRGHSKATHTSGHALAVAVDFDSRRCSGSLPVSGVGGRGWTLSDFDLIRTKSAATTSATRRARRFYMSSGNTVHF